MNAASGDSHQIWFDLVEPDRHIVLQSNLPAISKPQVLITGLKSPYPVIINGAGRHLVFWAANGSNNRELRLSALEIRNGALDNDAACIAAGSPAGGVIGILDLRGVVIRDCVASTDNHNATGGAVRSDRRHVEIVASEFVGNRVQGVGGALLVRGGDDRMQLTIRNSTFLDNGAEGNHPAAGGAVHADNVQLSVVGSRFIGNWTRLINPAPGGSPDVGAAIHATHSGGEIRDSLFHGHVSSADTIYIGSTMAADTLLVGNSQFIGNEVGHGSNLHAGNARVILRNVSVLGTTAAQALRPTAIFHGSPRVGPDTGLSIHNSLLAASAAPDDRVCGFVATGHPLHTRADNRVIASTDAPGCGLAANADLSGLAIEALRDNGGLVETVSLFADSVALDTGIPATPGGDYTTCLATDARGVTRPQAGSAGATPRCDVGAWESQGEPLFRHDFEEVLWRP